MCGANDVQLDALARAVAEHSLAGSKYINWDLVASSVPSRSAMQCCTQWFYRKDRPTCVPQKPHTVKVKKREMPCVTKGKEQVEQSAVNVTMEHVTYSPLTTLYLILLISLLKILLWDQKNCRVPSARNGQLKRLYYCIH